MERVALVPISADIPERCYTEVPGDLLDERGQLLDRVIGFAFDILGVRHLDVRVVPAASQPPTGNLQALFRNPG
jgi:hypothetical protein